MFKGTALLISKVFFKGKHPEMIQATLLRFVEFTAIEILLSALFAFLFNSGILTSYRWLVVLVMGILTVAFIGIQVYLMRVLCREMVEMRKYFICNLIAFAGMVFVGLVFLLLASPEIHTWFFGITKVFRFLTVFRISKGVSFLIFDALVLLSIFAAPLYLPPPARRPHRHNSHKEMPKTDAAKEEIDENNEKGEEIATVQVEAE